MLLQTFEGAKSENLWGFTMEVTEPIQWGRFLPLLQNLSLSQFLF